MIYVLTLKIYQSRFCDVEGWYHEYLHSYEVMGPSVLWDRQLLMFKVMRQDATRPSKQALSVPNSPCIIVEYTKSFKAIGDFIFLKII